MYTLNHYPKNYEYSNDTESLNFIIIKALRFLFSSRRIIHTLSFFLLRLSRFTSPKKVQKYENIYNIPKSHFPWKKCGYCAQVYSINSSLFYWSFFFFYLMSTFVEIGALVDIGLCFLFLLPNVLCGDIFVP